MQTLARLALCLSPFIVACSSSTGSAAGGERAVAATSAEVVRLSQDVAWLADDAREGRRAGTEGERVSALWLAARLKSLGLEAAGTSGSFLQEFQVPLAPRAGEASLVRMETDRGSRMVSEWKGVLPLFCSEAGAAEGPLVFCGFGIDSLDQQWNDFGERDLKGAIVVMLRGTPPQSELLPAAPSSGGTVEHSASFDGSIFQKVMGAKHRGASGVIVLQEAGALQPAAFDAGQSARAGIPTLSAPRSVFEALVGEARARELCAAADRRGQSDFGTGEKPIIVRIVADVLREQGTAFNVLARLPGRERARTVVIGAHYDHLGLGGEGSMAADRAGEIHNGADDNASGTAVVLELARAMAAGPVPAGDVVFALWSGEELGLLGSEYWCEHPTQDLASVRANLNLDMVGRARAPGERSSMPAMTVLGAGTAVPFEAWLEEGGPAVGLKLEISRSGFGTGGSDHMSFMKRRIPVLHFFTGVHADYHKPSDDSDKVDAEGMARIAQLGSVLVSRVQSVEQLGWNEDEPDLKQTREAPPAASNRGFSVWFGTVPTYGFEGPGLLLQGTSEGSPAQKAGLLAGDILLQVGDVRIDTIHDFVYALRIYKPGDVVLTRYLRKGSEESVRVALITRAAQ